MCGGAIIADFIPRQRPRTLTASELWPKRSEPQPQPPPPPGESISSSLSTLISQLTKQAHVT